MAKIMVSRLKKYFHQMKSLPRIMLYAARSQLRRDYLELLHSARFQNHLRLNHFGYSLYSQADEDGIIEEIFNRIGVTNRIFVEFGCGDGVISNTHALLLQGWKGLWIEGSDKLVAQITRQFASLIRAGQLQVEAQFITAENIDELIGNHFHGEIDLLCVDLDGNDFYVLDAIRVINPRVIIAEYNGNKGPKIDWVMQYNAQHHYDGSDYFGASLKALERLLTGKGYCLVGSSINGVNAFFVRSDEVGEGRFLAPFEAEEHYEPTNIHIGPGINMGARKRYGPWTTSRLQIPSDDQSSQSRSFRD